MKLLISACQVKCDVSILLNRVLLVYWQVIDFVRRHVGSGTPLLAGNSVYVDLLFLKVGMNNCQTFPCVFVAIEVFLFV
jgi:oligoribonuclease (3'-5' exoribonuclease)